MQLFIVLANCPQIQNFRNSQKPDHLRNYFSLKLFIIIQNFILPKEIGFVDFMIPKR